MSSKWRESLLPLLTASSVLALLTVTPLAIASTDRADDDTFSGSCHFSGTLTFDPPLKNDFQFVRTVARANGPCEGTFTNQRGITRTLGGELVRYYVKASGQISCGPGGQNTGTGFLRFGRQRLFFDFSEVRELGSATLTLEGFHSGSAAGQGSVSAEEDPVVLASKCMNEGLRQVRVKIEITTTPSISG